MHVVTGNHGQAWLFDLIPASEDFAPACIWVDIADPDGYRVVVPDDGHLFIKGTQVLSGPIELCP
jgi:hypothetical protein